MKGRKPGHLRLGRPGRPLTAIEPVPEDLPRKGQDLWERVAPKLSEMGLLTPVDIPAFHVMCMTYGLAFEAAEALAVDGLMTDGVHGTVKKHPAATILNEFLAQFRLWCAEFGLTPAARQRLQILPEEEIDDMEALLRR